MFDCDMIKKKKRKQYCFIIFGTFVLAGVLYLAVFLTRQRGDFVVVEVQNQEAIRFSLSENLTYEIDSKDGVNVLEIKDGFAKIVRADCENQICVHSKAISYRNESIVCLPHQVTVWVESNEEAEYDAFTN